MISNAGNSVKTLELQNVTALTDIRGRIARCDASISRLSADLQSNQTRVKQSNTEHLIQYQHLQDKIQAIQVKVIQLLESLCSVQENIVCKR